MRQTWDPVLRSSHNWILLGSLLVELSYGGQPQLQWARPLVDCLWKSSPLMSKPTKAMLLLATAESSSLAAGGACLKDFSSHLSDPYLICCVHSCASCLLHLGMACCMTSQ